MSTKEKVKLILKNHPSYNIQTLCDKLDITRPTYYNRMRKENWKSLEKNCVDDIYYLLVNLSDNELDSLPKVVTHSNTGKMVKHKPKKKKQPTQSLFDKLKRG